MGIAQRNADQVMISLIESGGPGGNRRYESGAAVNSVHL
jgi:hypothetical protein